MNSRWIYFTFAILVSGLYAPELFAQAAAIESERIQREQDIRREQQIQRSLDQIKRERFERPEVAVPEPQEGNCFDIETIEVRGSELLPDEVARTIVDPFENTCVGVTSIQRMLAELSRYFINNGYTTTRAYLPQQDLTSGTLIIEVEDGKVSSIQLEDGGKQSVHLPNIFPDIEGDFFNIRDFEQGLEQINRLSSNSATMNILPGEAPGESVVQIINDPRDILSYTFSVDNQGIESTGRRSATLAIAINNAFGVNEFISISRKASLPYKEDNQQSVADSFLFTLPYGYSLFTLGYSHSQYESGLLVGANELELSGDSDSRFAQWDYVAFRSQTDTITLSTNVTTKRSVNYFDNNRLDVSSRKLSLLEVGFDYETQFGGGLFSLGGDVTRGLDLFGALKDAKTAIDSTPKAQFTKFNLDASYNYPFAAYDESFLLSSSFRGQFSDDALFPSEQITVGGPFSVRGYLNESIANDHGAFMRNELRWNNALVQEPGINFPTWSASPYVALDFGGVGDSKQEGGASGFMVGVAAGARIVWGSVFADFALAKGISSPSEIGENEGTMGFFTLSATF